jgi:hypothetical protein
MKKYLLTISLISFGISLYAQTNYKNLTDYKNHQKLAKIAIAETGNVIKNENSSTSQNQFNFPNRADETIIGVTKYDLQTNNSMPRRIVNFGDGKLAATFTFTTEANASTRGTGYVFFNGTSWSSAPSSSSDQIESSRSGWPNIGKLGSNGEVIVSHGNTANALIMNKRSTKGSGTWNETTFSPTVAPFDTMQLWPRMSTGGLNGNTVHIIGRTESSLTAGMGDPIYFGMEGALVYCRSTNGGLTWDIRNKIIPGLDATNFIGIGGDTYAIDSKGNTVAVVVGGLAEGVALYKSTDNGSTWVMTWVLEPRIKKFDEAVHVISSDDPMPSSDGTVGLIIDNDDIVHVFYGYQEVSNETIGDGLLSYFPTMNSIEYWNEKMGGNEPVSIAGAPDVNGNGFLEIANDGQTYITSNYRFEGIASQPQAGIDNDGCIYIVYAAIHEEFYEFGDELSPNLRHIWGVKSCDGGCTWSEPVDLTPSESIEFSECVYPSIARHVDDNVHFIYQRDFQTSVSYIDDNHVAEDNDIIYVKAAVSEFDNSVGVCLVYLDEYTADEPLCPGESIVLAANCGLQYQWNDGSTTESIEVVTAGIYELTVTTECGDSTLVINLNDLIVFENSTVTLSATDANCTAEDGTVSTSIDGVSNPYSYLWSNGATTNNLTDLDFGQYIVTITDINNCTFIDTADVDLIDLLDGDISATTVTSACGASDGAIDYNILSGTPPYSFLWNNGETTSSLTGIPAGSYSISIIDDKGCEDYFTIDIIDNGAPTVSFINVMDVSCFGGNDGSAEATATGTGTSYTYTWLFDNSVNETATGLSIGTYKVQVVDNDGCKAFGDVIISQPTLLTAVVSGSTNPLCFGTADGTASLVASGGTTDYTYLWSNGQTDDMANGLASGTYTATITDANMCETTVSVSLTDPSNVTPTASSTSPACNGGDGVISASATGGNAPYTYLWSNGSSTNVASGLAGANTVTVTDNNGCVAIASTTMTEPDILYISNVTVTEVLTEAPYIGSIEITVSGGTSGYNFAWTGPNDFESSEQNLDNVANQGDYSVTITDANNCVYTETFTVAGNVSTNELVSNSNIKVYPNPNNGLFVVNVGQSKGDIYQIEVKNIIGQTVYNQQISTTVSNVDLSNVGKGIYFITISNNDSSYTEKIIVK